MMRARRSGDSMHGGLDGARFALRMALLTAQEGAQQVVPPSPHSRT